MTSPSTSRPGGRTARTSAKIVAAASQLLLEEHPAAITGAQIAAQAGVAETTIYRKWGSKDALLTEALLSLSHDRFDGEDTGSLRGDLVSVVEAVAEFLRTPAGFALAYANSSADDATSAELRAAFWGDRFAHAREIFERAVARGELADARGADLTYEVLIGTMHFHVLGLRESLDDGIAERLVNLVLGGLTTNATRGA